MSRVSKIPRLSRCILETQTLGKKTKEREEWRGRGRERAQERKGEDLTRVNTSPASGWICISSTSSSLVCGDGIDLLREKASTGEPWELVSEKLSDLGVHFLCGEPSFRFLIHGCAISAYLECALLFLPLSMLSKFPCLCGRSSSLVSQTAPPRFAGDDGDSGVERVRRNNSSPPCPRLCTFRPTILSVKRSCFPLYTVSSSSSLSCAFLRFLL